MQCIIMENTLIKLTLHDETKMVFGLPQIISYMARLGVSLHLHPWTKRNSVPRDDGDMFKNWSDISGTDGFGNGCQD